MTNSNNKLEENFTEIAIKLERACALINVIENSIEYNYNMDNKQLLSLCYILNDKLQEIKTKFTKLEEKIIN